MWSMLMILDTTQIYDLELVDSFSNIIFTIIWAAQAPNPKEEAQSNPLGLLSLIWLGLYHASFLE